MFSLMAKSNFGDNTLPMFVLIGLKAHVVGVLNATITTLGYVVIGNPVLVKPIR